MIDWQKVSIISGILNIILVILLFFKSAFNDILKEFWVDRKKKRLSKVFAYLFGSKECDFRGFRLSSSKSEK